MGSLYNFVLVVYCKNPVVSLLQMGSLYNQDIPDASRIWLSLSFKWEVSTTQSLPFSDLTTKTLSLSFKWEVSTTEKQLSLHCNGCLSPSNGNSLQPIAAKSLNINGPNGQFKGKTKLSGHVSIFSVSKIIISFQFSKSIEYQHQ